MNFFKKSVQFFVLGNFYISLAAGLMILETKIVFDLINPFSIGAFPMDRGLLIGFCFTFFVYNFQRLVKVYLLRSKGAVLGEKALFYHHNYYLLGFLTLSSGFFIAYFVFTQVTLQVLLWLIPCGIVSILYIFGIKRIAIPPLRNLPYTKTFLIAAVWAIVTVVFPVLRNSEIGFNLPLLLYTLAVFLFVFSIAIPFDIRDIAIDSKEGIITFPISLGIKRTKQIAYYCLVGYSGLIAFMNYMGFLNNRVFIALIFSAIIAAIIISFTDKKRTEYFYSVLVDGIMIIQFLLLLFASNI